VVDAICAIIKYDGDLQRPAIFLAANLRKHRADQILGDVGVVSIDVRPARIDWCLGAAYI